MAVDINVVKEYIKLLKDNHLTEISVQNGDQSFTIKDETSKGITQFLNTSSTEAQNNFSPVTTDVKTDTLNQTKGTPILSPMAGTFYSAASPAAEPYVKVGSKIESGQVICIIEAMKLMNELESEINGTILEICVKNGDTVEADQVLMMVE